MASSLAAALSIRPARALAALLTVATLSGCAASAGSDASPDARTDPAVASVERRLDELQAAVDAWASATELRDAHAAAELAANLVVGPDGPGFGDRDGDGTLAGDVERGLLSGAADAPAGLAATLDSRCVRSDVLGTTADDVTAGWREMDAAIAAWSPSNNTMPTLASHPMRVVGWATFTLGTDDLALAHEYAGHAQLHVDISRDALDC